MNEDFSKEDLANLRVVVQTSKTGFTKKYLEDLQRKITAAEARKIQIRDSVQKMVDCVGVANMIANKQNKVYIKWRELTKSGAEPIRRQCLATLHDGLQNVRDMLPCESTGSHFKKLLRIEENNPGYPISKSELKEMLVHAKAQWKRAGVQKDADLWQKQIKKIEKRLKSS